MSQDLEFNSNVQFLNFRLEKIKSNNENLQEELRLKEELFEKVEKKSMYWNNEEISIWKVVIRDNLIFGFSFNRDFVLTGDLDVILQCDSLKSFDYSVKTFSHFEEEKSNLVSVGEEIKEIVSILSVNKKREDYFESEWINSGKKFSEIVIVLSVPDFLKQDEYHYSGFFSFKENERDIRFIIPTFKITMEEVFNPVIKITENNLLNYSKEIILSYLSIYSAMDVIFCLKEVETNSLHHLFLKFMNKFLTVKGLYVSKHYSHPIIVKIHESVSNGTNIVRIFYKKITDLKSFLHFVLETLPIFLVIPDDKNVKIWKNIDGNAVKELLNGNDEVNKVIFQKLGKTLKTEVEMIEETIVPKNRDDHNNLVLNKEKYLTLRNEMLEMEDQSEILLQLAEKIHLK